MRSFILRVNPLILIAVGLCSLLGSFAIRDLRVALIAAGAYAVAAIVLLPSWRFPLLCLGFTAFAAVSIVYSTWRLGGHDEQEAITAGIRIVVLAWPGSVALGYVDPSRLADYLAQSLHLPARFVAAFSAALQRFAGLHTSWQQLDRARRMRGFGPSRNPIATGRYAADMSFGLLVNALRGASQSSIAMDARGFAYAQDRTWAEPAPWTRLDLQGLAVAVALGAVAPILAIF
ncbi:energy-coupling factor transporter transmembrane component T family protein [Aeromicrobium sp.]